MDRDSNIDFASVWIDQNYDALDKETGRKYKSKHMKDLGRAPAMIQKETVEGTLDFNDEELYYMNRIAFRNFKLWGASCHFNKFVDDLKILQDGEYSQRLKLWLTLVNESEMPSKPKAAPVAGPSPSETLLNLP